MELLDYIWSVEAPVFPALLRQVVARVDLDLEDINENSREEEPRHVYVLHPQNPRLVLLSEEQVVRIVPNLVPETHQQVREVDHREAELVNPHFDVQ